MQVCADYRPGPAAQSATLPRVDRCATAAPEDSLPDRSLRPMVRLVTAPLRGMTTTLAPRSRWFPASPEVCYS